MSAPETTDFEREFESLVRDLRAMPNEAPDELRSRVRELGEPVSARRLGGFFARRSLLVLAPACLLALVGAAIVHGLLSSSGSPRQAVSAEHVRGALRSRAGGATHARGRAPLAPAPARVQDYQASLRIRVEDLDALSTGTSDAMRVTRRLGGYVASVEYATPAGGPGEADLMLRVPVAHVQDALLQLAGLGAVVEQHVSIRDLQQLVQRQRKQIFDLRLFVARATKTLENPSLPADVRLRLELQLEDAKRSLAAATGRNATTLRQASLSRISLSLTTQKTLAAVTKHHDSRALRAIRGAGDFLASAGAIALYVLIVLSPLVLLLVAWLYGLRVYRRREERRLLAQG